MTPTSGGFGKNITRAEANDYFKRFVQIKAAGAPIINAAQNVSAAVRRHYSGREGSPPGTQDLCFIFDKEALNQILSMLNNDKADGLVVIPGARPAEQADGEGRPTLMLFPYKTKQDVNSGGTVFVPMLSKGAEHPGGWSVAPDATSGTRLPKSFRQTDILP